MEPTIYKPSIYKGAGIYKAGGSVDKFSSSPNMSMTEITDSIIYGRIKNTSNNQGVFKIPAFNYDNCNYIEYSMRYVIDGFNSGDGSVLIGQLFTGSISIDSPLSMSNNRTQFGIAINGVTNFINDLSFNVGDEVKISLKLDKPNSKAIISLFANGFVVVENLEFAGINGNLGTREFYVFGLRFDNPSPGYNGIATLIFDGTYIKIDNSLVWGIE